MTTRGEQSTRPQRFIFLKPIVTEALDLSPDSKNWRRPMWKWAYQELDRFVGDSDVMELKREIRVHQGGGTSTERMKQYITRGIIQEVLRQVLWERNGGEVCFQECQGSTACPYHNIPEDLLCPFRLKGWRRMNREHITPNVSHTEDHDDCRTGDA